MNNVFSFERWWKLIAKHWAENRKRYLLSLLALAGLLIAWNVFLIFAMSFRPITSEPQTITFFIGLFLTGCLYASFVFAELNNKAKGISFLSFPASHLEKLLVGLFYGVLFFLIAYTTVFYLVDFIMVNISNRLYRSKYQDGTTPDAQVINILDVMKDKQNGVNPAVYLILLFFALQAAYVLGSVYFGSYSFIKTTVSLLCVFLVFVFFFGKVLFPMLPEGVDYDSLTTLEFADTSGARKIVTLPESINSALTWMVKFLFAPLFYVAAYFRLKEKEI